MALKTYKPNTPGTRGLVLIDHSELHRGAPEKTLTVGKKSKGGRNNFGHVVVPHQGGGHKKKYRLIDFKRRKLDMPATVMRLEYDPNRTAFIALIEYKDGEKAYIVAPRKLAVGDVVVSGDRADIKPGNAMPLKSMPIGTIVHNVELKPGAGGQLARSAGCYAQLMGKDGVYAQIKMNSGELRKVHSNCMATVGSVSNPDQRNVNLGKAGRARWLGIRPTTRGIAMNPVDHPMGGGNGKSKGHEPVSRTGIPSKGYRTRKNKLTQKFIIRSRHLNKKKK
ncbi:MAG: 50S ribosomal protein L2 [Rickettsiales bacterium]|jgi:large subunit ribosomal protein L2|nr:50S ribosomal protein L2 [Rickettsiales bacterium]